MDNQNKQGTEEFETVAAAYKESKRFDDVTDFVRSQSGMPADNRLAESYSPTAGQSGGELFAAGAGKAVVDAGRGVKQMAGGEVSIPESDKALMQTGAGQAGNLFGNVAMFTPASMVPGANTYTGAAATGTLIGALNPTEGEESRSSNALTGALGGLGGRAVVGWLSRMANPNTRPEVSQLMSEGVTPTPGQIMGGAPRRLEEALRSVPFVGDGISAAEQRANQQFNTAAINRVLSPIGRRVAGYGQEALEQAHRIISGSYDDVLSKMAPLTPDEQFTEALRSARSIVSNLPEDKVGQFSRILKSEVTDKLDGPLSPQAFKRIQSELGRLSRGYRGSPDLDQRELGRAVSEVRKALTELAARRNPAQSQALRQVDEAYSGLLRVEDAAARNPTTEGVFTPGQLGMSTKKLDQSLRKRATSQGRARMQDFAQDARSVLGANLPDSGTANRLASILAVGGGYAIHPGVAGTMLAGRLAYSPGGQNMLATALARRPEQLRRVGQAISQAAPISGTIGGSVAVSQ